MDLGPWLESLQPLLSRDLGYPMVMAVAKLEPQVLVELVDPQGITRGLSPPSGPAHDGRYGAPKFFENVGAASGVSSHTAFRMFYQPFRVTTTQTLLGHLVDVPRIAERFLMPDSVDIGCLRCDAREYAFTVACGLGAGQPFPIQDRRLLRLQRHLTGAFAQRMAPAWEQSALVLDSSGSAIHCDVKAPPPHLRELRSLVARELEERQEPDERAELLWDDLWNSGWTVARIDDADGRRYLTIRRAKAEQPVLSPVERAVLAFARAGRSVKWIAAELGISNAGASMQLRSGLTKLGLKHRLELLRLR